MPALGVGMASVTSKVDVDSHELVDHLHKDGGWPLVFIGSPHSPRSICILGERVKFRPQHGDPFESYSVVRS